MKWAPTIIVLGAFGVLLWMTSNKPATTPGAASAEGRAPESPVAQAPAAPGAPAAGRAGAPAAVGTADEVVRPLPAAAQPAVPARSPDSIVGTVRDPAGAGVAQIVVRLTNAAGKELRSTRSDASGRFAFPDLEPGAYTITTSDPDHLYTASTPAPVTLRKDAVADAGVQVARGTAGIRGTVTNGSGDPLADRRVTLDAGGAEVSVMTDSKGRFVVNGLASGDWRVIPDGIARKAQTVHLADASMSEVRFELALPAAVKVAVTGSHLHPAKFAGGERALVRAAGAADAASLAAPLEIERDSAGSHRSARAAASFQNLAPGDWEIEVVDAAGARSLLHSGAPWSAPIPLTLREGEAREVVLPTALAALGRGSEVPTWAKVLMFVAIGLLVVGAPILFPPPLVPRKPAKTAGP